MFSLSTGMALSRSFSCTLASAHAVDSRLDPVSSAIARWNSVSIRRYSFGPAPFTSASFATRTSRRDGASPPARPAAAITATARAGSSPPAATFCASRSAAPVSIAKRKVSASVSLRAFCWASLRRSLTFGAGCE